MTSLRWDRASRLVAAGSLLLALAACGSSDGNERSTVDKLFFFGSAAEPPPPLVPKTNAAVELDADIDCPRVDVFPGGAAVQAFAGRSDDSGALAHQISLGQTARECHAAPGGGLIIKVGIEGQALLGPAGRPGTFSAPLNILIKRGETVIARRVRTVSASVPAGQTSGPFVVVEDGIAVPPGKGDLWITVGLGNPPGLAAEKPARRKRRG